MARERPRMRARSGSWQLLVTEDQDPLPAVAIRNHQAAAARERPRVRAEDTARMAALRLLRACTHSRSRHSSGTKSFAAGISTRFMGVEEAPRVLWVLKKLVMGLSRRFMGVSVMQCVLPFSRMSHSTSWIGGEVEHPLPPCVQER